KRFVSVSYFCSTEEVLFLCSIAKVVLRLLLSYFFLDKKVSKKSRRNKLADRSDSISSGWHHATCSFL
ncbi:MAG: hypothetical protein LPJ89_10445, partial [Hymenobacteraceae bacterium]|nr:hypothetical protein [Hymenobacteraceae bacterium]